MHTLGYVPPLKIPGYDGLVRSLLNGLDASGLVVDVVSDGTRRNLNADVVVVPYDFRVGVALAAERLAAEVTARLGHLSVGDRVGRVIVVGHSMGGLVARYWAATMPDQAAACAAILTLGTPHRGASKALEWLVNGVRIGSGLAAATSGLMLRDSTDTLRSWPGVYDLLPTYEVVDDQRRDRHVHAYGLAGPDGPGFAADQFYEFQARRALELHDLIRSVWAEPPWKPGYGPITAPFLARNHGTLHAARVEGGVLDVTKTDPQWQPNPGWQGDGTVPALSAIPPEMAAARYVDRWHHLTERHVPMASAAAVVQLVRSLVGDDVSAVRGWPVEGVRLGVDLEDAALVCEPVEVVAQYLTGDRPTPPTGFRVFVTAQPEDGTTGPEQIEAAPDGQVWRATFTPPQPGLWRVRVEAVNPQGEEPRMVTDTVAVLDLEGLGGAGIGRHVVTGGGQR